jgi:hypothetical protein
MTPRTLLSLPSILFAALLGAAPAGAQSYTSYPIDDLHSVFGHWAPFGILSTGNADETRSHYMIPAPFLAPGGAVISGIEVSPHVTGNVPFERLIIRCGLTTNPTLSGTFASNAAALVPVYTRTNFSINWASNTTWYPIQFTTPFPWDGTSNLVIEVEKVLDRPNNPNLPTISHQFSNLPMRRDLPLPIFREGAYNSGAATAPSGTAYSGGPLLMRVLWLGSPALRITNTRSMGGSYYRLGTMVSLTCQGRSGEPFGLFLDDQLASNPIRIPQIIGTFWLNRVILLGTGTLGTSGSSTVSFTIPNDQGLVGAKFWFQGGVASPTRLAFTNAVDAIVAQ